LSQVGVQIILILELNALIESRELFWQQEYIILFSSYIVTKLIMVNKQLELTP